MITIMPFGKHRGRKISDVPRAYLSWCLREMTDLYPETRAAIQDVVDGGQLPLREPGDESEDTTPRRGLARRRKAPGKALHEAPRAGEDERPDVVCCARCGGSAAGREMVHVECAQVEEVPF